MKLETTEFELLPGDLLIRVDSYLFWALLILQPVELERVRDLGEIKRGGRWHSGNSSVNVVYFGKNNVFIKKTILIGLYKDNVVLRDGEELEIP